MLLLLLVTVWLLLGQRVFGEQSVSLAWDSSPNPAVVGYVVYFGNASGAYTRRLDVQTNTTAVVTGLTEGQTYFFVVKGYDAMQAESTPSNEVSFLAPGALRMVPRARSLSPAHLTFPVVQGHSYELQATSDFQSWTTIWQVTGTTNCWVEYADNEAAALPNRFYRVHLLP